MLVPIFNWLPLPKCASGYLLGGCAAPIVPSSEAVCPNHASQKAVLPHRMQYCPNHAPVMPHRRQLPQSYLSPASISGSLPQSCHRRQYYHITAPIMPQSCPVMPQLCHTGGSTAPIMPQSWYCPNHAQIRFQSCLNTDPVRPPPPE
jgi:hypothetical protein